MIEWISVKERLPDCKIWCWVCDSDKDVFEALYTDECRTWGEYPLKNKWGFAVELLECYDKAIDDIEYWMPYFTPKPPDYNGMD